MAGEAMKIENKKVKLSFDDETGKLTSIINKVTGNEYLKGPTPTGNVFCIYHDFIKEFEIFAPKGSTPCFANIPREISRQVYEPSDETQISFTRRKTEKRHSLYITYRSDTSKIQAKLAVSMPFESEITDWKLTLKNNGESAVELMPSFPVFSGVKLGDGRRNLMVVNDQAGYILPLWSAVGGIYGNAKYMSMQWGCAFDEKSGDAFGFVIDDPDVHNKNISYYKPCIEVSYFPTVTIDPGQTLSLPSVKILVYSGDWKTTAVAYSRLFSRNFQTKKHADWVRDMDAHGSGWFAVDTEKGPQPVVEYTMDSFRDVTKIYRRVPMDNYEFAFHCQRSRPKKVTGKSMLWTDGDNVLREDLGGAKALREGLREVHGLGHHFTFYIEGYLCPGDADVVTKGKGSDWAVINKDGTNDGSYTEQGKELGSGLLHMCPGAKGWQDHLARTAARLVRETGADGVRLDSLGFYFFPCYNTKHKHAHPFEYNVWVRQLLEKVATAVLRVNPDCLLTTEGGPDFFSPFFDGSLTQQWLDEKIAVTRDVSPMRVAAPDYCIVAHGPCGPVAASLMGYPGGVTGTGTSDRMKELDLKWRTVRSSAASVIRLGNAAHDNPLATRNDVECRRFSTDSTDVIVGARPLYSDEWKQAEKRLGVVMNSDVDIKKGNVSYSVTFSSGARKPSAAVVWDIEKLRMDQITPHAENGKVTFQVRANWFMATFLYKGALPMSCLTLPSGAAPGDEVSLTFGLLGASKGSTFRGKLLAPVLGISGQKVVRVPGTITARVPDSIIPGVYQMRLDAKSFAGSRCFLKIQANANRAEVV